MTTYISSEAQKIMEWSNRHSELRRGSVLMTKKKNSKNHETFTEKIRFMYFEARPPDRRTKQSID